MDVGNIIESDDYFKKCVSINRTKIKTKILFDLMFRLIINYILTTCVVKIL